MGRMMKSWTVRQTTSALCWTIWLLLASWLLVAGRPVSIARLDDVADVYLRAAYRRCLHCDKLSPSARNVLHRWALSMLARCALTREGASPVPPQRLPSISHGGNGRTVIALAEMAFLYAEKSHKQPYFLAGYGLMLLCLPFLENTWSRQNFSTTHACAWPPTYTTSASSRALHRLTALPSRSGMETMNCRLAESR